MPVNLNGLDPRVLRALKQIEADARARGIQTSELSAVRSLEDQKELYANYRAGQAGQPLPYPERGAVPLAAAPGTSLHEKGLAFDLQATDPAKQGELRALAPKYGLKTIGDSDPNHFELASSSTSSQGGGAPAPGGDFGSSPFLTALQRFESHGSNVPNTHQTTSSGQAQGFNQITTGTWADFGGTKYAPDALHATREQQNEIASTIPLKRWAPETLDYLRSQGFKVDPNKTLGENVVANGGAMPSGAPGGTAVASAAPPPSDWQSLLGAEPPPESDLGSMLSSAVDVAPARTAAANPISAPETEAPPVDLAYTPVAASADELGARYAQNKAARQLSPLGQLFTLPTIGPPKPKAPSYMTGIG